MRDNEQIPLLEEAALRRSLNEKCSPMFRILGIDNTKTKIGYEISFTGHFYKPVAMRTLDEITADIYALQHQTEGLLESITGEA